MHTGRHHSSSNGLLTPTSAHVKLQLWKENVGNQLSHYFKKYMMPD